MGIRDELESSFGSDFFTPASDREPYRNWQALCVCGHLRRYHAPSIGGDYRLATSTGIIQGEQVITSTSFDGCVGAMPGRSFEAQTSTLDREAHTIVNRVNPTCPCTDFRHVVNVDRPNRYFNQRMPRNRDDASRHPLTVGVRAFLTHLGKRRAADPAKGGDPSWVDREFARRFTWVDGARKCAISECRETDNVWPILIDGETSELRCAAHR